MARRRRLTLKQKRFISGYLKEGNATKAVRKAYPGIKTKGAQSVMGSKLVRNGNIQEIIEEVLKEAGLTPELIIKELLGLIVSDDKTEKNKAIRTAAEIMGLIGKGAFIFNQINSDNKGIYQDIDELLRRYKKDQE